MKDTALEPGSIDVGDEADLPENVNMWNTYYDHTYCYTVNTFDHTYCQPADKYDYIEAVEETEIVIEEEVAAVFEDELVIEFEAYPVGQNVGANETVGIGEKRQTKNAEAQRREFVAREQRRERFTIAAAAERRRRETVECICLSESEESESAADENEDVEIEFEAVDVDGIIEIRPKKSVEQPAITKHFRAKETREPFHRRLAAGNERGRLERRNPTPDERFAARAMERETPESRKKRLAAEEREKRRLYIEKHKRIARLEHEKLERRRIYNAKRKEKMECETLEEREKRLAADARRRSRVIEREYARRR